jgi:hypothetical protein
VATKTKTAAGKVAAKAKSAGQTAGKKVAGAAKTVKSAAKTTASKAKTAAGKAKTAVSNAVGGAAKKSPAKKAPARTKKSGGGIGSSKLVKEAKEVVIEVLTGAAKGAAQGAAEVVVEKVEPVAEQTPQGAKRSRT